LAHPRPGALRPAIRETQLIIHEEQQLNPVAGEVQALLAVVGPILKGVLYALKEEVVAEAGDR